LEDDLSYYKELREETGDVMKSIFVGQLEMARKVKGYSENSARAASRNCDSWMMVQRVGIGTSLYDFKFLCKTEREKWTVVAGNAFKSSFTVPSEAVSDVDADRILMSAAVRPCVCSSSSVDAPSYFLTAWDGHSLSRNAVHLPRRNEAGASFERQVAANLVLDAFALGH
jgi:hypothetical protein